MVLVQQEINIKQTVYEYVINEDNKTIILPSPAGMHAGMKRHYYFKKYFGEQYYLTIVNKKSWNQYKENNEIKILNIEEK